jgi:glycosyltransferase involved in cell wall biosynthesis
MIETAPPQEAVRRRVRVVLVGPSLDILGGQAVQLQRLLRRLREVPSLDVDFLPVNPRLPGIFRLLQRVKYARTVSTSAAYVASLYRSLRDYDVVHAFSASYWSYLLAPLPAMWIAHRFGKAVVLNYRSGEADDHLANWRTAVRTMRIADTIAVPSGYLVDVFGRHDLRARAIFNFVEAEKIPYRRRTKPTPVFLSNRNLEPLYDVERVLRAFHLIQRELPDARLIVAGDGTQRQSLEALTRSLDLKNVEFRGRTPPERMVTLYDEADVYLNSPVIDNMPNSVIEAFAAGLPVVTSDAGGIPYIVRDGENGLVVPAGDEVALAAAALRLFREPGLADRLSLAAREECLAKYVWSAVGDEWERLYLEMAELTPRRADAHRSRAAAASGSPDGSPAR